MKTQFTFLLIVITTMSLSAQERKTKTYQQSRSAETGRYVSKKEAQSSPKTTYTINRKR